MMRRITAIIGLSMLLVAASAPAVQAAKPVVIELPPIIYDDPFVCGGDPVVHVTYSGTLRLTLWFDAAGNLVRDAVTPGGMVTVAFSSDATDRTLTSLSPAPFRTTYNADGSIDTLTANGLNAIIAFPGDGVVLLDTGALTWAGGFGGELVASGGSHEWHVGGDVAAFCDYLSA